MLRSRGASERTEFSSQHFESQHESSCDLGGAELMDQLAGRMAPIKESHLEQSALSAALGSPNGKPPQ